MYLIPEPQIWKKTEDVFLLDYTVRIVLDRSCPQEGLFYAQLLREEAEQYAGAAPAVTRHAGEGRAIVMRVRESVLCDHAAPCGTGALFDDAVLCGQAYHLTVTETTVTVTGGGVKGLLYGVQTLRQMIRQQGAALPGCEITDYPQMKTRGYYLDVTRGRIPTMEYLKKVIDRLAFYKYDQLQLYVEQSYQFEDLSEVWRDDTPLTAEDMLEIDAYCAKYQIDLVPSLSCFGHLYKILRTKGYHRYCELEGTREEPFSFIDRMDHHTIDVSNKESIGLVKQWILEYMPLFRSEYFNICADETFDLGKGKSREAAEKLGTERLYIDHVKELCEFVKEQGKIPMFWGDIICRFPEAVRELPQETVCLTWGYEKDQDDETVRLMKEAGARQYCCPGVCGWNQFANRLDIAYENIRRMCSYAFQYDAEGVLVTDWGDFGHINHPEFSVPAMIYGSACTWNTVYTKNNPSHEVLNRQISALEYGDRTESLADLAEQLGASMEWTWEMAVHCKEKGEHSPQPDRIPALEKSILQIRTIREKMCRLSREISPEARKILQAYILMADGMILLQRTAADIAGDAVRLQQDAGEIAGDAVRSDSARDLEFWFAEYKKLWRSVSRESELYHLQEVIVWYADRCRR